MKRNARKRRNPLLPLVEGGALQMLLARYDDSKVSESARQDVTVGVGRFLEAAGKNFEAFKARQIQRLAAPRSESEQPSTGDVIPEEEMTPEQLAAHLALLEDLKQKAVQAQDTQDPAVLAELIDGLMAFLDDEIEETQQAAEGDDDDPEAEGDPSASSDESDVVNAGQPIAQRDLAAKAQSQKPKPSLPGKDPNRVAKPVPRPIAASAQGQDTPQTPKEVSKPAADSAEPETVEQAATEISRPVSVPCEACGHENVITPSPRRGQGGGGMEDQGRPTGDQRAKESDAPLTEDERKELMELRVEKRQRLLEAQARESATKAIDDYAKENQIDPDLFSEVIKPEELMAFSEAQRPALLRFALDHLPQVPRGFAGTGQIAMAPPHSSARTVKREAGSLFRERYNGSAAPKAEAK